VKIVVDCATWRRGGNFPTTKNGKDCSANVAYGATCLLNSKGYKCCLGFAALQLGYTKEDIFDMGGPSRLTGSANILRTEAGKNTDFSERAMSVNDDSLLNDRQRMKALQEIGRQYGVRFEFINKPEE
jgi:hypothetical protein